MGTTRLAIVGSLLVALLAGCGGDEPEAPAGDADAGTAPAPTATETPAGPASVDVGEEFWFAGFHVTVERASYDPAAETGPTVTVEAAFENLGSAPRVFDGTPSLAAGGSFYEPALSQDLPNVPGRSTGAGAFVFDVDEGFAFDDALLTVGLADLNQAVIPLGTSGEAVSLEPRSLDVRGKTRAGVIGIELSGGELRADVLEKHEQIARGSLALTLDFDVTNFASYAGGFAFVVGNNLALELPDGTTIAAEDGPIELLQVGTTLPDQQVRFTVPDPPEGRYALVLIDDTRDRRKPVRFEITRSV